jgi:hypothetical protein
MGPARYDVRYRRTLTGTTDRIMLRAVHNRGKAATTTMIRAVLQDRFGNAVNH